MASALYNFNSLRNHPTRPQALSQGAHAGTPVAVPQNDSKLVAKLTQNPTLTFHVEFARPETSDTPKHEVNMLALSIPTAVKHVRAAER